MSWKFACEIKEVPEGIMKRVDIGGVDVLLVGREGGITAIPPMCPHLEEPLETGMCDGKVLTCLKHLWQWDIDTGEPVGLAEAPLKMYQTKEEEGRLYVFVEQEIAYDRDS